MDSVLSELSSFVSTFPKTSEDVMSLLPPPSSLLTASHPYGSELCMFFMAVSSAVAVRSKGAPRPYRWFHTYAHVTLVGFGGGAFAPLLLGRPTGLIVRADATCGLSFLAFWLVFHCPADAFYSLCKLLPMKLLYTFYTTLFKSGGVPGYTKLGHDVAQPYSYGISLLGPVLSSCFLSNAGPVFRMGWDEWFKNGMPWQFENGLYVATFYTLYVHDEEGWIGEVRERDWEGRGFEYSVGLLFRFSLTPPINENPRRNARRL